MTEATRVLGAVALQAIEDWQALALCCPDKEQVAIARLLGFAGPVDELRSYFHSVHFTNAVQGALLEPEDCLAELGAEPTELCPCQSCAVADEIQAADGPGSVYAAVARTLVRYMPLGRIS